LAAEGGDPVAAPLGLGGGVSGEGGGGDQGSGSSLLSVGHRGGKPVLMIETPTKQPRLAVILAIQFICLV